MRVNCILWKTKRWLALLLASLLLLISMVWVSPWAARRSSALTDVAAVASTPETLYPDKDAFVYSDKPDEPGMPNEQIFVGYDKLHGYKKERGLLHFDLTEKVPAGATINRATLRLYLAFWQYPSGSSAPMEVKVHRLLNGDWQEDRVTWNTQPSYDEDEKIVTRAIPPGPAGPYDFDVGALVQQWVNREVANNGLALIGDESEGYHDRGFWSKDCNEECGDDQEKWPQLIFEYTEPTPTPTPTPTVPRLSLRLQNDPATEVKAGDEITYTIWYSNTGAGLLTNVVITGHIPSDTIYVPGSATDDVQLENSQIVWRPEDLQEEDGDEVYYRVKVATDENSSLVEGYAGPTATPAMTSTSTETPTSTATPTPTPTTTKSSSAYDPPTTTPTSTPTPTSTSTGMPIHTPTATSTATPTTTATLTPTPTTTRTPTPLVIVNWAEGYSDQTGPVRSNYVFNGGWRVYLPMIMKG